ncbi:MAG: ribosome-associated translation inhibitor RaiA [Deltaproteobacteria bacterium]|nr:ribosome-associated translation inhibitor RaiA [Deltaproteobacteria bacterium]MBW2070508.1 ribosome-associated translation inhibitor RaiA [Deltaproteobacteria bacterium]
MQVSVTFRKIDASETLRNYAEEKLYRIKKYVEDPIEAHVVLSVEKFRHVAEVTINANGIRIKGAQQTEDMYSAIDMAVDKLESQIKKYRERLKQHKGDGGARSQVFTLTAGGEEGFEEDQGPQIIKTEQVYAKPMDLDEAVMQMELAEGEFLVFTNSRTKHINVLYRRKDGNYGLIEPVV